MIPLLLMLACDSATEESGGAADSGGPEPFIVRMLVWQPEPDVCFQVEDVVVDEALWKPWVDGGCDEQPDGFGDVHYGTADGRCIKIQGGLWGEYSPEAECLVNDPWVLPCADVPGCCDVPTNDTACDGSYL